MARLVLVAALALAAPAAAGDPSVSRNWSGYAVRGTNVSTGEPVRFTAVAASWVLPKVTCVRSTTTYSSFWVGLGGSDGESKTIEQIGTIGRQQMRHAHMLHSIAALPGNDGRMIWRQFGEYRAHFRFLNFICVVQNDRRHAQA